MNPRTPLQRTYRSRPPPQFQSEKTADYFEGQAEGLVLDDLEPDAEILEGFVRFKENENSWKPSGAPVVSAVGFSLTLSLRVENGWATREVVERLQR